MNKPKTRNKNIVIQEMEKEILIYDLKTNKAFCLNETSAIIYQLCDGKNSIADIAQRLSKQSNQPINDELICLALDGLKKENLLEDSDKFEIDFKGLSRRQIIRKAGLSSLAILPVIASVVSPVAAAVGSSCLSPIIGVCMMGGVEACPVSCPDATLITGTLYASVDGTCSGGIVGGFFASCPGPVFPSDFRIN